MPPPDPQLPAGSPPKKVAAVPPLARPRVFPAPVTIPLKEGGALQTKLLNAVADARAAGEFPDRKIPISIVDLDTMEYAGVEDRDMYFSGSLLKTGAMYAACELQLALDEFAATLPAADLARLYTEKGGVKRVSRPPAHFNNTIKAWAGSVRAQWKANRGIHALTSFMFCLPDYEAAFEVDDAGSPTVKLSAGIVANGFDPIPNGGTPANVAASTIIKATGYGYINGALAHAGFLRIAKGATTHNGVWVGGSYLRDPGGYSYHRVPSKNDDLAGTATTTIDMARLFVHLLRAKTKTQTWTVLKTIAEEDEAADSPHRRSMLHARFPVLMDGKKLKAIANKGGSGDIDSSNGGGQTLSEAILFGRSKDEPRYVVVCQNLRQLVKNGKKDNNSDFLPVDKVVAKVLFP